MGNCDFEGAGGFVLRVSATFTRSARGETAQLHFALGGLFFWGEENNVYNEKQAASQLNPSRITRWWWSSMAEVFLADMRTSLRHGANQHSIQSSSQ
ncbi:hypothetical protein KOW79_006560 [Hemibagrus wyckioides]|uniref:Uncharacterized protein n=1 Tax=Hemibagrus wyckioides TaxID=337641 RepID=A0A9D3NWL4_9TELE|nr:hypothetical protein KOW79_006560 [Hemibagrus wyckioides]